MKGITCIEDLRLVARRRVPRAFFGYVEAGSYSEQTLRANRVDLERVRLRQRVLVDVSETDTNTTILGEKASLPIVLAPIGMGGLQRGGRGSARCAAQAARWLSL
jgi:L-lactate dehydrogenase (cytochrome)